MAETVTDILETRLNLEGEQAYRRGMDGATRSLTDFMRAGDDLVSGGLARSFGEIVAGAALAGTMIRGLGRAALAAGEDAAAFERAAGNFKGAFSPEEIAEFTGGLQSMTGVADDAIAGFVGLLGTFKLTAAQAKELTLPILNAAEALKAQKVTTEQLALQIGKAFQTGDASALRRSGIIIDEVGLKSLDAAGRVKALAKAMNDQGGDAAIRFRRTLPGSVQALETAIGSLSEAIGEPLVKPLTMIANLAERLASALAGASPEVKTLAAGIAVALTGAVVGVTIKMTIAAVATARLAHEYMNLAVQASRAAAAQTAMGATLPGAAGAGGGAKGGLGGALKMGALGLAGFGLSQVQGDDWWQKGLRVTGAAGMGAAAGSLAGPWGAAIGGIGSAIFALVGELQKKEQQGDVLDELKKQTAAAEKQNQLMEESLKRQGGALGTNSGFSAADQTIAMQLQRMVG